MTPIKIVDILPILEGESLPSFMDDRKLLAEAIREQTAGNARMEIESLRFGATSLESEYDFALNTPFILEVVKKAADNGASAIVIDCFGDPGLYAARELVKVPVVGANQASTYLASQLGNSFSIVNALPHTEPIARSLAAKYGLSERLASIKTLGIPVLELAENEKSKSAVIEAVTEAVRKDSADVIVFGCTGMSSFVSSVQTKLSRMSLDIPIIEPLRAAVYTALALSFNGVAHSKKAFPNPRTKLRKLPDELGLLSSS